MPCYCSREFDVRHHLLTNRVQSLAYRELRKYVCDVEKDCSFSKQRACERFGSVEGLVVSCSPYTDPDKLCGRSQTHTCEGQVVAPASLRADNAQG